MQNKTSAAQNSNSVVVNKQFVPTTSYKEHYIVGLSNVINNNLLQHLIYQRQEGNC